MTARSYYIGAPVAQARRAMPVEEARETEGQGGAAASTPLETFKEAEAKLGGKRFVRYAADRAGSSGRVENSSFSVSLEVVTPILGGAPQLREVDKIDIIRAPAIRGHLRFWWRALYGHNYPDARELYQAESALWGRAADKNGGRSAVEVGVTDVKNVEEPYKSSVDLHDPSGYALWPAGVPKENLAERRNPGGLKFTLKVWTPVAESGSLDIPRTDVQVKNAVKAWIMFGGIASRSRRGVGSLTVASASQRQEWLVGSSAIEAMVQHIGIDIRKAPKHRSRTPTLAETKFYIGAPTGSAIDAWKTALSWLREFRQGMDSGARERATPNPGEDDRPGRSNWPEPDRIRLSSWFDDKLPKQWAHRPRYKKGCYPRSGFGMPIVGKFQPQSRIRRPKKSKAQKTDQTKKETKNLLWSELAASDKNYGQEPRGQFDIRWRTGGKVRDRLASPLIVKAMPLANGDYVPCALWLSREMPKDAEVGLYNKNSSQLRPNSIAPFGFSKALMGRHDGVDFELLNGKTTLRDAFCDWLGKQPGVTRVTP